MLHWFRLDNCYSYAESDGKINGISMVARNAKDASSSITPIERGNMHIWKVASIYGPNASGKSNFFKALCSMFRNIASTGSRLVGESFFYDGNLYDEPIRCEICFSLPKPGSKNDDQGYNLFVYGYALRTDENGKADTVSSEWLAMRDIDSTGELIDVFHRNGNGVTFYNVDEETQEGLCSYESALVLQLAGNVDTEPFSSIHAWFRSVFHSELLTEQEGRWQLCTVAELVKGEDSYKDELERLLIDYDHSIKGIGVSESNGNYELLIERMMHNAKPGTDETKWRKISDESEGTQKIAGMYQFLHEARVKGRLVMVDELDIKLHPWAVRDIIKTFQDDKNQAAQLIFSSHNLVTLNKEDMQVDGIYFVEKNERGKSLIARLNKTLLVKGDLESGHADYEKLYMDGKFGAIPLNELRFSRL